MSERAGFEQQISQIDTQLKNMATKMESLKSERSKLEGVIEYITQKAVLHRFAKENEPDKQESLKSEDDKDNKIDTDRVEAKIDTKVPPTTEETLPTQPQPSGSNGVEDKSKVIVTPSNTLAPNPKTLKSRSEVPTT